MKDGRIAALGVGAPTFEGLPVLDAGGLVCAPGFVDLHVHFREPGQEEKETVATGSRAAAAGGFTTVVTMPNTQPAIDNAGMVRYVIDRGNEAGLCRVLPTGAISVGRNGEAMAEFGAMVEAGAVGFTDDGSPGGERQADEQRPEVREVARRADHQPRRGPDHRRQGLHARRLLVDAPGPDRHAARRRGRRRVPRHRAGARGRAGTCTWRTSRPRASSTSSAGPRPRASRSRPRPRRTTSRQDHSRCRDYSPLFKMNPPLREPDDVAAVAEGLADGTIDCIATDHAPHTATEKELQFDQAPFGVIGLETAFGAGVTYLVDAGKLDLGQLIRCMSERPAQILKLATGRLEAGLEADFVLLDPERRVDGRPGRPCGRGAATRRSSARPSRVWWWPRSCGED